MAMRLLWKVVAFFLLVCACIQVVECGQTPLLVRLGIRQSRIPQFIRDLGHPWVLDNTALLESLDTADALCNAESPLRSQLPTVPIDLFNKLMVDNQAGKADRLGWQNSMDRLSEMKGCPEALRNCEHFRVNIHRHSGAYGGPSEERMPPEAVPNLFVDVLSQMEKLQELEWIRPSEDAAVSAIFESTFIEHQLSLPTVKEMQLGPNMQFLIPLAPELTTLKATKDYLWRDRESLDSPNSFISMAANAKAITWFNMSAEWEVDLVESVLDAMPLLEHLSIDGRIGPLFYMHGYGSRFLEGVEIKNIIMTLKRFKNLSSVQLPGAWGLGLDDDHGPGCGNMYFGLQGTQYGRGESRRYIVDAERVTNMVLEHLPDLDLLCIGSGCVNPRVRTEEGKLVWPWTGRMKDYLLEDWPRYKAGDSPEDEGVDEDPNGPIFGRWEDDKVMLDENWVMEPDDWEELDQKELAYGGY